MSHCFKLVVVVVVAQTISNAP